MQFFDSHAHYNDEKFNGDKQILEEIYKENVTRIVCAGYNLSSSIEAINIAKEKDFVFATCGISPNDIEDRDNFYKLEELK